MDQKTIRTLRINGVIARLDEVISTPGVGDRASDAARAAAVLISDLVREREDFLTKLHRLLQEERNAGG